MIILEWYLKLDTMVSEARYTSVNGGRLKILALNKCFKVYQYRLNK